MRDDTYSFIWINKKRLFKTVFFSMRMLSLSDYGRTDKEHTCQCYDSIQLRKYGQDKCIAKYIMSLTDGGDAVGTNLSLTDGGEEPHQAHSHAAGKDRCSLDGGDLRCQNGKNTLKHEVTGKT